MPGAAAEPSMRACYGVVTGSTTRCIDVLSRTQTLSSILVREVARRTAFLAPPSCRSLRPSSVRAHAFRQSVNFISRLPGPRTDSINRIIHHPHSVGHAQRRIFWVRPEACHDAREGLLLNFAVTMCRPLRYALRRIG